MSQLPLVSLLCPTYNRLEFLPQMLRCFLSQMYELIELVVLDDGDDGTYKLFEGNTDPRIRYFHELPKQNHGWKMNRCCELAKGELIIVFDSDDFYAPDRVSKQIEPLLRDPHLQVSGTSQLYYALHNTQRAFRYVNLTNINWMGAIAFRKSAWETNKFDEMPYGADCNFLSRIPRDQWCDLKDTTLLISTIHPGNASPKGGLPSPSFVEEPWETVERIMSVKGVQL